MAGSADRAPIQLLQLPLNPSSPLENTGNIPLAGAILAASAGLPPESVVQREVADRMGDRAILEYLLEQRPELVAFTLYMWNAERSVHLAESIRNSDPDILLVAGGPEVTGDNLWLRDSAAFHLLVSGEGEGMARELLDPGEVTSLARTTGGFIETGIWDFPPGSHPDPWLEGYLDPADASVHVETVRGCSGGCDYCSYRRIHPSPRYMKPEQVIEYARKLKMLGARELVFLDPTFNSRPGLDRILQGLGEIGLDFFAEMRGDLITPGQAEMIGRAGFRSVEIGLQSCRRESLEACGRMSDPIKVMEGAMHLRRAGVTPIVDLILGLPGDSPEDSIATATMLVDRELHHNVQVFHLSVLPGTVLRERSGGSYMQRPPYFRFSPPDMGGFTRARETIADIVGYDLDIETRPVLFDNWPGSVEINLRTHEGPILIPSARQASLRIRSADIWADRNRLFSLVQSARRADPYCALDVILIPEVEFPLDLIDRLRELEDPVDYSGRVAGALGREGNLRVVVLLEDIRPFSLDWTAAMAGYCTTVVDVHHPSELPSELIRSGVCPRLCGRTVSIGEIESYVPSLHQVFFRERSMEVEWCSALDL